MFEETNPATPSALPESANLDWLRKQARRRLRELRASRPDTTLAAAQFAIAKQYGFPSWRALKRHIDSLTVDAQLFDAARTGDVPRLRALLDEHPEKRFIRDKPYEWTLLHAAASRIPNLKEPKDSLGASRFESDALGWARHFNMHVVVQMLSNRE